MNYKRMTLRDRIKIQSQIESNPSSSLVTISNIIKFNPSSIYREIKNNRISFDTRSIKFNKSSRASDCHHLLKFPFICNACKKRKNCSKEIWNMTHLKRMLEELQS